MNETEFCRRLVFNFPGKAFKVHGNRFQEVGLPDIIGCWHGQFVGIECKLEGNEPTPIQWQKLYAFAKRGAISIVATLKKGGEICFTLLLVKTYSDIDCVSLEPLQVSTISPLRLHNLFSSAVSLLKQTNPQFADPLQLTKEKSSNE